MATKFSVPEGFLKQLNEFTSGGYLILTFDAFGSPRLTCKFDSSVHSMACQHYLKQWLDAVDETQRGLLLDALCEDLEEEEEEEKPDDNEE